MFRKTVYNFGSNERLAEVRELGLTVRHVRCCYVVIGEAAAPVAALPIIWLSAGLVAKLLCFS